MHPRSPHRPVPAPRAPVSSRRRLAGAAALAVTALGLAAACHDNVGPGACFDSGAQAYSFYLNGDTSLTFHWPSSYMPVRVYAEPTGELPADVLNAMTLWTGAFRCGELSLAVASDSIHADIIVRNPSFLPVARAAVRAVHSDSIGACTGVTQFALDSAGTALVGPMRAYVSPYAGFDSASVAACYRIATAHELGHALGLLAHSADTADLMYPVPRHATLSSADRYTIQLLYHTPATIGPPPRR